MTSLRLDCRRLADGVVIGVAGELDASSADDLETYVGRVWQPGRPLILDLGGLTFMDSTGLHVLLRVHGEVRRQGGRLHLAAVQDLPARLLQITEVWDALSIHPSAEAAIANLSEPPPPRLRRLMGERPPERR
ncbi:Anti-sigma F factor antagonist (spoIIAA-2); Anti-sigma B factor antagonist RsbV [[Actinomadura] parvosata subsp. kistnae]|uniref:STAS domain-containing protein n=1 Tax=[Actinomadura] parvosata TaxID=1955412 RepID=UPI0009ACF912|nr:STAS domain-containing protein [Nonomuraea sp. ATCC 55076]SPL87860.1 Anti-sigma F factor antagonist (spoIIAA-2); Anti-sigma B factor antagonist RsbV [Actinomadura parvosata subsp. kistnae]